MTTRDLDRKPTDVARILSHELGHFLGLFHTTEKNGKATDLLVDTPECKHDPDKDGIMGSDECHQDGASNTMWWTLRPLASEFSEEQSWVIARSPAAQ